MAFSDPIQIYPTVASGTGTLANFVRKSTLAQGGGDWMLSSSTSTDRTVLSVRYATVGKKTAAKQYPDKRMLVRIVREKLNSTTGLIESAVLNLTLTYPVAAGLARSDFDQMLAYGCNFINVTANVDKLFQELG